MSDFVELIDGDDWEKGKAHAYRRVLRDLTRILEGHNDE